MPSYLLPSTQSKNGLNAHLFSFAHFLATMTKPPPVTIDHPWERAQMAHGLSWKPWLYLRSEYSVTITATWMLVINTSYHRRGSRRKRVSVQGTLIIFHYSSFLLTIKQYRTWQVLVAQHDSPCCVKQGCLHLPPTTLSLKTKVGGPLRPMWPLCPCFEQQAVFAPTTNYPIAHNKGGGVTFMR